MLKSTLAIVASLSFCAEAQAETERFRIEKTESGIVRIDTRTGAMTLCREEAGNLVCHMAADERAAYEAELDRLEKRVTALEQKLANAPAQALPGDDEIDRSLSIMERFMRRFMAIIGEFTGNDALKRPQPDRT